MARHVGRGAGGLGCLVLGLVVWAATAQSAEIQLRGGGRVSGVIVQRTNESVTIETGPGLVTLPMSRVEKIVDAPSALDAWIERSSILSDRDVEGWTALAEWAEQSDLSTQARIAWQHVLAVNPRSPEANAGLDRVLVGRDWMTREDGYRAQGLVPFEGRWVTRAEYEGALQQRTEEAAASQQAREAEARIREAEARAREAEARARNAETMTSAPAEDGGVPIYGGYYGGYYAGYDPPYEDTPPPVVVAPAPPVPSVPPSSIGPVQGQRAPAAGGVHVGSPPTTGAAGSAARPNGSAPRSPRSSIH